MRKPRRGHRNKRDFDKAYEKYVLEPRLVKEMEAKLKGPIREHRVESLQIDEHKFVLPAPIGLTPGVSLTFTTTHPVKSVTRLQINYVELPEEGCKFNVVTKYT